MAISHTDLRTKLGKIFGGLNELNTYRGTTLVTRQATLVTAYGGDADGLLDELAPARLDMQNAMNSFVTYSSDLVAQTIITAVNNDRTTAFTDIEPALIEWVRQLTNDAQTFNDAPCTVTPAAVGSPQADYTFVGTTKEGDGKDSDFAIPDVYLLTVSADADRGGTRWAETLALLSKTTDVAVTDASYPKGTGLSTTLTVVDPNTDGGIVTDGTFANYTSGAFTSWTRFTSLTDTDVNRVADDYRNGSDGFALNLVSDGTNLTGVKQTVTVEPSTVYAVYFVVKPIDDTENTAEVHVSLRNAATNAVLTDANGASLTVSSTGMTTIGVGTWAKFTATWATPEYLPEDGVYLDIRLADGTVVTTVADAGTACYVDHVSLQPVTPLYTRGVGLVAFSGITTPLMTDQWSVTTALASGTMSSYIIRWLDRTIGLASRTFKIPTLAGGTETLTDAAIS